MMRVRADSLQTVAVVRKTFTAEAVQITDDNIIDVSNWSGARIKETDGGILLRLDTGVPKASRQATTAGVGDWIVCTGEGFKIYRGRSFDHTFEVLKANPDKFDAVHTLVRSAMIEQDNATYHQTSADMTAVAENIARKICDLI